MCAPDAVGYIDSSYLKGKITATWIENPLYDVALENVYGVRDSCNPSTT